MILKRAIIILMMLGSLVGCSTTSNRQSSVTPETAVSPLSSNTQPQPAQTINVRLDGNTRTYQTRQTTLGAFMADVGITVQPTSRIMADGRSIPTTVLNRVELPANLEIDIYFTVTIQDGNERQIIRTAAPSVEEAIKEAGIMLFAADKVEPALSNWIVPEMTIEITRSIPLTILVDGRTVQIRSHHTHANDVLAEAGITLIEQDYTQPNTDQALQPNDTISVVRVTEAFEVTDTPITYQTLFQASSELDLDTRANISYGAAGIRRKRIRIRYENGVEVSRIDDGEWVEQEPINEVIGYGTRINIGVVDTPTGAREYWRVVRMRVTSYTAASSGRAADDPRYGITASGVQAGFGVVAIDRAVVPFRSDVFVPGYGVGFAGDTGGGVRGRWIDLGYDEDNYVSWSGYVDVYYLTPVPAPDNINYLIPQALP